jgi:hypothetical protein
MERRRQTFEEIISNLSRIESAGDMARIVDKKRHDTTLLFVTDGITWKLRANDLRRLIEMQNQGKIARIYTSKMFPDLRQDLLRLRSEYGLDPDV